MYEKFFNLNTKPFELVPNPEFLFLSRPHKKALTYLDYGISERIGFILLTGEVGSGKTTIIRNLIKGLNGNATLSKVFNTKVTSEQLIAMINEDFGLDVTGKDKISMLRELNDFLIDQYAKKSQPILIIDEAQNLSPELLEEVRMLSNLETDKSKLLQIIMVGQPELRKTLVMPELRQLRQRISISCHIFPLTKNETEEYILHRLDVAGNRDAVTFSEEAFDVIHNFSRGIPRLVNIICDFLMLSAFAEERKNITKELVNEVIGELEMENRYWQDEAPERLISGGEEALLKELINRTNRLEEEVFKTQITQTEKVEIFGRLSSLEKMLNTFTSMSQTETVKRDTQLNDIHREIEALKIMTAEHEALKFMQSEYKKINESGSEAERESPLGRILS